MMKARAVRTTVGAGAVLAVVVGVPLPFGPGPRPQANRIATELPAVARSLVSTAVGRQDRALWVRRAGGRIVVENAGQGLRARFSRHGATVWSGGWRWS